MLKITVIGAGNGGQAIAGNLAIRGYEVALYCRNLNKNKKLIENQGVYLKGEIDGFGKIRTITEDMSVALKDADVIMIVTTADAHGQIAIQMLPYLKDDQIIVLNPGRTGGAFELRRIFNESSLNKNIYIVEAQSLVYACRLIEPGTVQILGIKDRVYYSTFPASDCQKVKTVLNELFRSFLPVNNALRTSLENIGAILHPTIVLFNACRIERGEKFYFYNDITPHVCSVLKKVDNERLQIGEAYGLKLISIEEWITFAYEGIEGNDFYSKMKNNPAYYKIISPSTINSRLLIEDIPTGILPMIEFGKVAGLSLPLMNSIYNLSVALLNKDFYSNGRTLKRLGFGNMTVSQILKKL